MVDYGFTVIAPKGKRQFIRILPITLGFPGNTSTSISKKWNGDLTTGVRTLLPYSALCWLSELSKKEIYCNFNGVLP